MAKKSKKYIATQYVNYIYYKVYRSARYDHKSILFCIFIILIDVNGFLDDNQQRRRNKFKASGANTRSFRHVSLQMYGKKIANS